MTRHEDGSATIATAAGEMTVTAEQFKGLVEAARAGQLDRQDSVHRSQAPEDDS